MFRVFSILPAAGTGSRVGKYPPKQFQLIEGKPLISYTIDIFESLKWVEKVLVVIAVDEFETMRKILRDHNHSNKVVLIPGEDTRHGSIRNGIKYMHSGHVDVPPDIVIVHDGVRPFVTETDLNNVAMEAFKNGAAGFIRPSVSTVVSKDKEGFLNEVFDRRHCYGSETPQAFRYETIKEAYESCKPLDIMYGTECLHLVQKYTIATKVKLLEGDAHLWKVTYDKDLYAVTGLMKENNTKLVFVGNETNTWRNLLHTVTKSKDSSVCDSVETIPKPTIQNVIIVYETFSKTLNENTKSCVDYFGKNCIKNCTIIHVVTSYRSEDTYKTMRETLKQQVKYVKDKNIAVYGICADQESLCNVIGNAISSVIRDRNLDLSGQLFIF